MYAATTAGSIADATRASDAPESGVNSAGKKKPYAVRKSDHLRRSLRGLAHAVPFDGEGAQRELLLRGQHRGQLGVVDLRPRA